MTLASDDFNSASIDGNWTLYEPGSPDVTGSYTSGVTSGSDLVLQFSCSDACDIWHTGVTAPLLLQAHDDSDFDVSLRVPDIANSNIRSAGIGVFSDSSGPDVNNWVRWERVYISAEKLFGATRLGGANAVTEYNSTTGGTDDWIRLVFDSATNGFTCYSGTDGESWTERDSYTLAITCDYVGIYVISTSGAFTEEYDQWTVAGAGGGGAALPVGRGLTHSPLLNPRTLTG